MARNEDSFELDESGRSEYVPAVFARSMEEAEKYRELLDEHDIPAIVGDDEDAATKRRRKGISRGLPVLVPEALLDEASEVIAACDEEADEFEADDERLDEEDEEDEKDEEEDEEDLDLKEGFEIEAEGDDLEEEDEDEFEESEDEEKDDEEEEEKEDEKEDK